VSREPHDPLIETALSITDAGDVDWDTVRAALPGEPGAVEALRSIAQLASLADATDDVAVAGDAAVVADGTAPERAHGRWGPLELRERLGVGSFGDVYVAWDAKLQREVALKLHRRRSAERSRRWIQEARRLARVRHPNVVTVYGAEVHDGVAGSWMELVRGRTLEERLRRDGPLSAREAVLVGVDLCGALAAVHGAGLVHGDVKPSNVVREGQHADVGDAGRTVLMDFGSAHDSTLDEAHAPGTPLSTAPEVLEGGRSTPASDLWSLGALLYRLVSGRWPTAAKPLEDRRARPARHGAPSLRATRGGLPAAFVTVVDRALARDPQRRPRDAAEMERELLAVLGADTAVSARTEQRERRGRRIRRLVTFAALAALAAGAVWAGRTYGPRAWMAWRSRTQPLVSQLVASQSGISANSWHGAFVRTIGDWNGDGRTDVAVGAPGAGETGQVYLLTPFRTGLTPFLTLRGEKLGDQFGMADVPGDLNDDGYPDLVVSAPTHDRPGGLDAGRVYVYFGGPRADTIPDLVFDGAHDTQYCGWGIGGGDVNGDGITDLLIGAPYDVTVGPQGGRAYVLFGGRHMDAKPDLELGSDSEWSSFGCGINYVGDFNGDGAGDFLVSAYTHPGGGNRRGRAYLYYGGPLLDDRPDLVFEGTVDRGMFGSARTPAADLNGDGWPDLVLGAELGTGFEPNAGSVSIYFGGPRADAVADLVLRGERSGDGFGMFTSTMSDADGDGVVDLLVGAPWVDAPGKDRVGRAYLYLGGRHMDDVPDLVVTGTQREGVLGWSGCVIAGDPGSPGQLLLGIRAATRPYIGQGAIELYSLAYWQVLPPNAADDWRPGGRAMLRWRGPHKADVALSTDAGATWRTVARAAGGHAENAMRVDVPAGVAGPVRVRLTLAGQQRGAVEREIPLGH
jgi:hypothetical protein